MPTYLIILIFVTISLMVYSAIGLIKNMRKLDGQNEKIFEFDDLITFADAYQLVEVVTLKISKAAPTKHVSSKGKVTPVCLPAIEIKERYTESVEY